MDMSTVRSQVIDASDSSAFTRHRSHAGWVGITGLPTNDAVTKSKCIAKSSPWCQHAKSNMVRTVPLALKLQCWRLKMVTSAGNNASWTEMHLDFGFSFGRSKRLSTSRCRSSPLGPRESSTAKAKQILDMESGLEMHMLQQHAQRRHVLSLETLSQLNNRFNTSFFPRDTQIFSFQNSGQLT